ncbi:sulfite exporter TauE/SafE family protein [Crocinitomix algicola]|uniref:sulfite exporter TauE/SafE family protein n=1 Tax=Crocinitomix algicola TaxID=1740263 RepID=UPI00087344BD|nr:sulfite exporter TauE/SafE family protein [Crocinitomix algicola]
MTFQTLLLLIFIGLFAGAMSGFIGIGGGVIMVPALVYIMGLSQLEAQGTSLILMLPPIGILAVMNYYKAGEINVTYGIIIAIAFIVGGYFGSKLALRMNEDLIKIIFGILLLYISFKLIFSGVKNMQGDKNNPKIENTTE